MLREYLLKILNEYLIEKENDFADNQLANYIRSQANQSISDDIFKRDMYKVTASAGQGGWAEIPWLGIFDQSISISAQKGYDIVYLFRGDAEGVYLSLNQGYTFYKETYKNKNPKEKIDKVSKYWHAKLNMMRETNGFTSNEICLNGKANSDLPKGYELGNIYSKYYSKEDLLSIEEETLLSDLEHMKMVFSELKSLLTEDYNIVNHNIINNHSIEKLKAAILDKNVDTTFKKNIIGREVSVPNDLVLKETVNPGKTIRKKDYESELKRNTRQGELTEKVTLEIEKERLQSIAQLKEYVDKIEHVSIEIGDGAGYDIKSFDYNSEKDEVFEYYIEVKSTTGGLNNPFYMSDNEYKVAKEKGESYSIYRLFKNTGGEWDYYVIKDPCNGNIEVTPTQYKVIPKVK